MRRQVRIERPADRVWPWIGHPDRLATWFPGIESCSVEGDRRTIVTGSGSALTEQIVTNDPLQRRFQYRLDLPLLKEHLSTVDVLEVGEHSCLVVYGADAEPATLALLIAGAAGNALRTLKGMLESEEDDH